MYFVTKLNDALKKKILAKEQDYDVFAQLNICISLYNISTVLSGKIKCKKLYGSIKYANILFSFPYYFLPVNLRQ